MGSFPYQQRKGGLLGREEFNDATNNSSKQFLRSLRTLLLRIRTAGQLRQGFVVEKHFVELKDLCRSVCAELGTTTAVFDDLWTTVVRQRRGDAASSHQHGSGESKQYAQAVNDAGPTPVMTQGGFFFYTYIQMSSLDAACNETTTYNSS